GIFPAGGNQPGNRKGQSRTWAGAQSRCFLVRILWSAAVGDDRFESGGLFLRSAHRGYEAGRRPRITSGSRLIVKRALDMRHRSGTREFQKIRKLSPLLDALCGQMPCFPPPTDIRPPPTDLGESIHEPLPPAVP